MCKNRLNKLSLYLYYKEFKTLLRHLTRDGPKPKSPFGYSFVSISLTNFAAFFAAVQTPS